MGQLSLVAENPEGERWDVAIVGTGMGGATVGYELARRGHRVLFLEKGKFFQNEMDRGTGRMSLREDNRPEARLARGRWPLPIQGGTSFGAVEFFAPLGCGSGGSTILYGAQLERLAPCDFQPRANYPDVHDSALPDAWPITYEEMLPYYRRAEDLYRVCGTPDPLRPDATVALRQPPPLSERDEQLFASFQQLGLHPYRAHVGFEFIEGCEECGGVICPRACKSDAAHICLMPALVNHDAKLVPECEVIRLDADQNTVAAIHCRRNDRETTIKARIVVLAANAFMTPILLMNSRSTTWPHGLANRSGLVGRHLMFHCSDFVAVRPKASVSTIGPRKALALNDFYVSDQGKLGTFQSVGIAVNPGYVLHYLRMLAKKDPKWWRGLTKPFLRPAAYVGAYYFRGAAVFATIVEDLPYYENRVMPDPMAKNGFRFQYTYTQDLRRRNEAFRSILVERLARQHRLAFLSGKNNINYGHVCGTCRFGINPETSVLDKHNRSHDVKNLFVVDASFFPSSGGINPSLTIAANSLRVAEEIDRQLT